MRILATPTPVSEDVSIKHRLRALASYARKLHYSVKSGSITQDQFNQQIGLTEYYAMMLYGRSMEQGSRMSFRNCRSEH